MNFCQFSGSASFHRSVEYRIFRISKSVPVLDIVEWGVKAWLALLDSLELLGYTWEELLIIDWVHGDLLERNRNSESCTTSLTSKQSIIITRIPSAPVPAKLQISVVVYCLIEPKYNPST